MFTGIITHLGEITEYNTDSTTKSLIAGPIKIKLLDLNGIQDSQKIREFFNKVKLGCSIAVNGICLTVTYFDSENNLFCVDVSDETISKTNLSFLGKNNTSFLVNLEHSLVLGDSLDGHLVQGHVDTIATVYNTTENNNNRVISFILEGNREYFKYIASKGSVTLNGISLTVNAIDNNIFTVNLIPHTLEKTNFKNLKKGDSVNLEVDLLSRYSVNYLEFINKEEQE